MRRHAGSPVEGVTSGRSRPDPTPSRLALGIGGLAAASALVTAIVGPASPVQLPVGGAQAGAAQADGVVTNSAAQPPTVTKQRPVQYVQLAPGQSPPPGATVIDAKAPKPVTIVTQVPAPRQQTIVVRTTQSGRVLP
jgi:hypothetical protein